MPYYLSNILISVFPNGFNPNFEFYLSSAGFVVSVLAGVYLLHEYIKHGRSAKFILLWLVGMALVYWFRIPTIFANAGLRFVLDNFNSFLAIAFPVSVLGFILMLLGVQSIYPSLEKRKMIRLSLLWFVASALGFGIMFLKTGFTDYVPAFMVNLVFFVPIRLVILYSLWRWYCGWKGLASRWSRAGILLMGAGMLLGVFQHFVALRQLLLYPPEFWFTALQSYQPLFILEASSALLLLAGVLLAHKDCLRIQK